MKINEIKELIQALEASSLTTLAVTTTPLLMFLLTLPA